MRGGARAPRCTSSFPFFYYFSLLALVTPSVTVTFFRAGPGHSFCLCAALFGWLITLCDLLRYGRYAVTEFFRSGPGLSFCHCDTLPGCPGHSFCHCDTLPGLPGHSLQSTPFTCQTHLRWQVAIR